MQIIKGKDYDDWKTYQNILGLREKMKRHNLTTGVERTSYSCK